MLLGVEKTVLNVIAIDPSIRKLGFAFWNEGKLIYAALFSSTKPVNSWQERALSMAHAVTNICRKYVVFDPVVVIEMPANWFDARGEAAKDSEAIQKLYYFTGMQVAMLDVVMRPTIILGVTASAWKGQAPKNVMQKRVLRTLYDNNFPIVKDHNVCEAVLIGKYALLNKEKYLERDTRLRLPELPFQLIASRGDRTAATRVEPQVGKLLSMRYYGSVSIKDYYRGGTT